MSKAEPEKQPTEKKQDSLYFRTRLAVQNVIDKFTIGLEILDGYEKADHIPPSVRKADPAKYVFAFLSHLYKQAEHVKGMRAK